MDFLPHPSEPLSKKLRLTLERPPPPIDPITGQPQVLYDYSPEGTPIWRPEETDEEVLGKTVKRIWDDKGGLAKFDERGLKDAIERGEEMDAEEDPEEEAKREQEEREGVDRFKDGITLEQMKELKVEIEDRLGQATHALGNFHHILTLLLPSSLTNLPNPNLAHLLPPHIPLEPSSFSTTSISNPYSQVSSSSTPANKIITPSFALLAQRQASLRETANLFATSAKELASVVEGSKKEWQTALEVREGGGLSLGMKDGRESGFAAWGSAGGRGSDAKDWQAWYGLDHSSLPHRAKHFAQLSSAATSSPSSSTSRLSFPNRSHRRLLITLQTTQPDGSVQTVHSDLQPEEGIDEDLAVGKEIREAMWEATDEEVFNEVLAEARSSPIFLPALLTPHSLTLAISPQLTLTISLHPSSSPLPSPSSSSSSTNVSSLPSSYPTLLSSLFTLQLLNLHAYRRLSAYHAQHPVKDPSKQQPQQAGAAGARPSVLRGVVEMVQLESFWMKMRSWVGNLRDGLTGGKDAQGLGFEGVRIEWAGGGEGSERIGMGSGLDLKPGGGGREMNVREEGLTAVIRFSINAVPITLRLSPPSQLSLSKILPSSTTTAPPQPTRIPIADLAHLSHLLSSEITTAVLDELVSRFSRSTEVVSSDVRDGSRKETKTVAFVDVLGQTAVLQSTRGEIRFHPSISIQSSDGAPLLSGKALSYVPNTKTGGSGLILKTTRLWMAAMPGPTLSDWAEDAWREDLL